MTVRAFLFKPTSCENYESFEWFICGTRYFDPITHSYVFELSPATTLYEVSTGIVWITKKKLLLLVGDSFSLSFLKENNFDGVVSTKECGFECSCKESSSVLCTDIFVEVFEKDLKPMQESPLVEFSKRHYPSLSRTIGGFPTPDELMVMCNENNVSEVNKFLFNVLFNSSL